MKRWLERALNIHPGDLGRGTLLCSCLFLIITTYKIGGVAGPALFLSRFQARQLAYADISSALLVILVVAGYVRVARRVPFQGLLLGTTLFFASNCVLFWSLIHYLHLAWLFPVFYVRVKIFGVLIPTPIWTLANFVLTPREAKRVVGQAGGVLFVLSAGDSRRDLCRVFGDHADGLAVPRHRAADAAKKRCSRRFFRRLQFLCRNTFTRISVAGDSAIPAQIRYRRVTVR